MVYSQISFTGKQKGRRDALRNVILCGVATVEDIERAVLEQNAHLPEEELKPFSTMLGKFFFDTEAEDYKNELEHKIPNYIQLAIGEYNKKVPQVSGVQL